MENSDKKATKKKRYERPVKLSALVIVSLIAGSFYAEYVVSRPCPDAVVYSATLCMFILAAFTVIQLIKFILKENEK